MRLNTVVRQSPCKVNLLLNILRKREDGYHELETIMQPVPFSDRLTVGRASSGIQLTCNLATLPVDGTNLVHKAAVAFLQVAGITEGVQIHLEKNIPLAAGLGGGSGNAGGSAGKPNGSVNTGGGGYGSINGFTNGLGGSGIVIIAIPRG